MAEFTFNKEIAEERRRKKTFTFDERARKEAIERRQKSALEAQKKREEQERLANFTSNNKAVEFMMNNRGDKQMLKNVGAGKALEYIQAREDYLKNRERLMNLDYAAELQRADAKDKELSNLLSDLDDVQSQIVNLNTLKNRAESDRQYKEKAGWDVTHDIGLIEEYNTKIADLTTKQAQLLSSVDYDVLDKNTQQAIRDEIAAIRKDARKAEYYQKGKKLRDEALAAPDFETNNKYGEDVDALWNLAGYDGYLEQQLVETTNFNSDFYNAMTEEERKIYGYYLAQPITDEQVMQAGATPGHPVATAYLESIAEDVEERRMRQILAEHQTDNEKLGYLFSYGGNLFASQLAGLSDQIAGVEKYRPTSGAIMAGQQFSNELEGWRKWTYDAGTSAVQMTPSLLVGLANPTAGAVLMGAAASGGAYSEMINEGYSWEQAAAYGTLVGVSEATLEKILGGVVGVDKISSAIIPNLKRTWQRIAVQIGEDVISEFSEESLQTILEPVFKAWVTSGDYKAPDAYEILYSGALGAITGGMFSGANVGGKSIANTVIERAQNAQIQSDLGESILGFDTANEDIKKLIDNAQQSGDKKLQKAANKVAKTEKDGAYDVSARKVGRLAQMSKEQLAQSLMDTATGNDLKSQTIEKLTKSGMNQKGAERAFDLIARDASRGSESKELQSLINKNSDIRTMYDNMVEYLSEEAVTKRVEDVAKASPVPEITNRITEQRLKDAGIDVVDEGGDIDNIDSVVNVDEYGNFILKRESGATYTYDPNTDKLPNVDGKNAKKVTYAANFSANGANTYVKLAPDNATSQYKADFTSIYNQGATGKAFSQIETDISPEAQKAIYEAGKADRDAATERRQKAETEAKEKEATFVKKQMGFKSDRVTLSEEAVAKIKSVSDKGISDQYKAAVKVIDGLAKMLQVNINIVASETDANGNYIGARGMYNRATNTFTFDIMSGMDNIADISYSAMIKTAGHELTHFIQNWSPSKYLTLKNTTLKFLTEEHSEQWINEQLKDIQKNNKATGNNLTLEQAKDELVADAFEDVLSNIDFAETILRTDKTLFDKIHSWVKKNVNDFKKNLGIAVKDVEANSEAATTMRKAGERAQALYDQWADAFSTALENSTSGQTGVEVGNGLNVDQAIKLYEQGFSVDDESGEVFSVRHSFATNPEIAIGKKNIDIDGLAKLVATTTGKSVSEARKWINSELSIASLVLNNPEYLDFLPDERFEAIKKNSDYPQGTVDLSNNCPKRQELTAMFDLLQKRHPDTLYTAADVVKMRDILAKHKLTTACNFCFVEDRRQLLGEIAETYIGMWKEAVETGKPLHKTNAEGRKIKLSVTTALAKQFGVTKGADIMPTDTYIPTQYDLTTYEGFRLLEKNHPTVALGYIRYNNSRGQQAGRLIEGRAEYKRQILGWSPAKVRSVNNNGGLRIFSFSDFEVVHLLDIVQIIIDCSAMGVKIQGYTKIPAFARLVRDTGIKLNRSLVPLGDTGIKIVNGKKVLAYDNVEGIDYLDENFLDERDNPNIGNILIGINAEQIGIAFLDDFVDYIIPFHSNKAKEILKKLKISAWENYKESQHEKDISSGKASKKNVNIYTQVINKYNPKNKVDFVNAFLKECRAQQKIPRYAEFLNKEYKADGAYKDEGGSFDYTYREGYHKLLVDFKMFDKNGKILPQGNITPNFDDGFIAKLIKAEVKKKSSYEFPKEVFAEIEKEFADPDTQLSARPQRDSEGNNLTDAQQEYFKDSKVRDKDGNLLVVRHGTDADFNVFDFSKSGKNGKAEGYGFYFSDDPEITNKYGAKQKEVYLNITKPLYNNKRTINKAELIKLTNALIDFDVEKYKDEGLTWQDSFLSNYVMTYDMTRQSAVREFVNQIWNYNTTDQDLVFEIAQGDGRYYDSSTMKEFYEVLTASIGYDGIIAEWEHEGGTSNVYVTFESNQSKNTTNTNPTADPDIRYQVRRSNKNYLDVESRFGVAESVSKYAETVSDPALKAKLKANATTYAKKLDEYETESIRYDNATANGWDEMAATAYYAMTMAKTVINQIETDADFALSLETAVGAFENYSEETRKQYQEKYKKAIAESKDKVAYIRNEMRAMQRDISDSERKAKEFAQREKKANYRAKQIELRNQRDRYMSFLSKEKTRIKTALEKPSETASVPKDTQELAKKLIGVIDSFNKFNNSSALTKSSAELIEKIVSIANAEMEAGRSKSLVQKTNATDKVLLGLKLSFDQVRSSLDALVAEYEKLSPEYKRKDGEKAPSAAAAIVYDEQLHNALKELAKNFSAPELVFEHGLSYVYEGIKVIRAMNHQLLKANQMYVKGKSVEVLKLRNMLLQDVKMASPFLNKFLGNALVSNVLMPKTMLHIVFGATENADVFYDMFDDGQMRYIRFMNGAREIFAPVANEIENEKFKSDKPTLKTGLKYMDGTDVLLNYEFALSFIKIVENEDSLRHAVWGGLQIPDLIPYNKGDKSAYNSKRLVEHAQPEYAPDAMTDEQIAKTLEKASEEGRTITDQEYLDMYAQQIVWNNRQNLAKEIEAKYKAAALMLKEQMSKTETGKKALTMLSLMTRYYDQYARKYLNEATMELYGFEKTLQEGKTYYPIRVRKDEKATDDNVDIIRDFSLENWGSMKHRVDSKKGIELYGALTELESYMENTAKFYAWTTVTKNMKKILNTQIIDDNGTVTTLVGKVNQLYGSYDPNVKGVKNIKNKFMSGFEQYMKDLQTEIIGANKGGEKWAKLQGAFVTNALLLNISTPLVQYSATPLVAVDSGYLSFIKTVAKGGKIPALLSEAQKKYVAKYSEVYKYRSSGLINVDLAAAKQNKGVVSKALSSKALAWTESADAQVLGKQFYALLDHVKRTHKGISAEEAARIAGKQLDQTIYEFQANYTVLQRAPVLRGSGIKKLLFGTFRTQQITLLNAMIDSSVRSHTLSVQMKQVKRDSPEYKALERKRSDSMKRTAKIHLAIALSNALNAFIRMGVGFIRRKDDDEKGETAFIDFLDSYLSMIPLFGDIASAIVSIASGRMFYGEKVFSLGMLDTLSDSITSAVEFVGMLFDGEDQELSKYIKELTDALAVSGVPARNIYNIIKMIMGWAEDAADAAGWDWDLDVDEW